MKLSHFASNKIIVCIMWDKLYNIESYRIVKQRISFSGSQYGSCSTTYNTSPVKKVVYN